MLRHDFVLSILKYILVSFLIIETIFNAYLLSLECTEMTLIILFMPLCFSRPYFTMQSTNFQSLTCWMTWWRQDWKCKVLGCFCKNIERANRMLFPLIPEMLYYDILPNWQSILHDVADLDLHDCEVNNLCCFL